MTHPMPNDALDITEPDPRREERRPRPFIGVRFACANIYVRVLRSPDGTAYIARCPACAKSMRFLVGAEGSDRRFFEVSCR